jgi:hypothetical protein
VRLRNTFLLALVFILLGAYVYFFELQKGAKEKTERLLNFREEEVAGIILNYPQQEIRLRKEVLGRWKITHPLESAADESTVSAILAALNTGEVKRTFEGKPSEADLKNYGLDRPEVKVLITLRNGVALPPISVGAKTPVGNSAYIRRGAEPGVLLTDASIRSNLEKKLNDFRNKEILSVPRDQVAKLQITTPKETLVLAKGEKDEWRVEAPKKGVAKQPVVSDYLTLLSHLRAKGFADDEAKDLKKYGLDSPAVKISAAAKDGKIVATLLVGNKTGIEYYAAREGNPTVYTIDEFSYNELNKQLTDFLEQEKKENPAPGKTKN